MWSGFYFGLGIMLSFFTATICALFGLYLIGLVQDRSLKRRRSKQFAVWQGNVIPFRGPSDQHLGASPGLQSEAVITSAIDTF